MQGCRPERESSFNTGAATGSLSSFAIDPHSGELYFINKVPTHGTDPCHVTVDQTGRHALVANFASGSVSVLPIREDGSLTDASGVIQHDGSSADPVRQSGPHAHPWFETKPGAGPRHFMFHPNNNFAYLINELDSTIVSLGYDRETGTVEEIQTVPALPESFGGQSTCADIHVDPSGRFLFGSNRGHDSIVIYTIDGRTGKLTYVGHESTQGRAPRNFVIDPTGKFLFAANQDTDNVVHFSIDQQSGRLTPSGQITSAPTPVCLKILG
jgi:6-phosphogluconolactonase